MQQVACKKCFVTHGVGPASEMQKATLAQWLAFWHYALQFARQYYWQYS
jgi:hypothetical protein